ncbi:S-layer homology domain-containing protein [Butyricicoccus sp. OF27-2pH9A]|uniref:S-layer homology domain-containing protein n=1 Tax=Butyricicoccus sp. OF27-2pH9A TaxID=3002517 RepID=UPI0022E6293F|nr:S-layer homology domain-containing protein [Butyricicoccus sp. OF27-2pH9A]
MLKKNMRKRLLAGALATIMALTMCPTWALADDEGITTLPAPEDQMSVVDSTPAEDTIQTPDAETQGQPEAQDPAQAPSGGTDIEETGNNSNSNENDSQNNDAVSNSPANTISLQEIQSDRAWYRKTEAMYFILLPKRGTPKNNADQGQENYLPSSDDTAAGITGSDGGVEGLSASTGYRGYVTAKAMRKLAYQNAIDGFDNENGLNDTDYLEVPENLGFFTAKNWVNGSYTQPTNTVETARNALLNTDDFTFTPDGVEIVWYTIKDQYDGIHVDGYLRGVPITVTYHTNYENNGITGMEENSKVDNNGVKSGYKYTVRDIDFTDFERPENYTFAGWYVGSTKYDVDSQYLLTGDLHLYAKWVKNAYNVTYYVDGAKYEQEKTYKVDSVVNVKNDRPEKEGYTFKGWKTNDVTVKNDGTFTMPEKDVRFDAEFEINKYNVTWKNDDDSVVGTAEVNYKDTPKSNPEVSKASNEQFDYEFVGWKVEGAEGTEDTALVDPTTIPVVKDVTYIAVFKPITRQYTVTWVSEGTKLDDEKVVYNQTPKKTFTPEKKSTPEFDYEFLGWKVKDGSNALVNPNTIAVIADVTYEAVFKSITRQYTVTYYVNGEKQGDEETYNYGTLVKIRGNAVKEGHTFSGWKIGSEAAKDFEIKSNVIIQGFFTQNTQHYTINKHFYNEKDVEVKAENGETKTGNEYALVAELYKDDAVNQTVDGKTYVYVPGLTKVTDNLEKLTKDVTIDLYYYLDVKGGEKPDETGNGTPDAWEYRLAFKVVNGEWNNGGSADIVVYVPFKDYKTGKTLKYVEVPVTRIPAVGDKPNSGYRAGSWDTTPVGNAKVEKDTVFTYTYARRSSSGGGGGGSHKPTVTIPDDVPTGLNGDDHYAYIVGYPDSTVRPQNGITRAEVATIFFRLLTDETRNANSTKTNSYSDVAAGAWYNHAVSTLSAMGIVKGDSQGKFNPNAPITRAEFAAIAARFDDKANTTAVDFSDIASHWAKDEISAAANNGWINGYTDGTFRPNNKITRAEAMTLVNRVLKRLPETAEDLHNDMIKWSDNSDTSAWYYLAVQEATNSHYYDIKGNKHEKWSKLRETRDWTELEK